MLFLSIEGIGLSWILLGTSLLHPYRIFQSSLILLLIFGTFSKSHRIHGPLAIIFMIVFIASQIVARMKLGTLADAG